MAEPTPTDAPAGPPAEKTAAGRWADELLDLVRTAERLPGRFADLADRMPAEAADVGPLHAAFRALGGPATPAALTESLGQWEGRVATAGAAAGRRLVGLLTTAHRELARLFAEGAVDPADPVVAWDALPEADRVTIPVDRGVLYCVRTAGLPDHLRRDDLPAYLRDGTPVVVLGWAAAGDPPPPWFAWANCLTLTRALEDGRLRRAEVDADRAARDRAAAEAAERQRRIAEARARVAELEQEEDRARRDRQERLHEAAAERAGYRR